MISVEKAIAITSDLFTNKNFDDVSTDELVSILTLADDLYYNDSSEESFLSDSQYDTLYQYTKTIDPTNQYFLGVGSLVRGGKVKLPYQMGSLDQIYTGDIIKYVASNNLSQIASVLSHKLDGNSAMAIWNASGNFQIGYSRGNGIDGADLTRHLTLIPSVPKTINTTESFVVRGEVIIKTSNFAKVQDIVKTRGGKQYKNPRNAVSGLMNAKENVSTVYQYIDFVAYEIVGSSLSKEEQLKLLSSMGFLTAKYETYLFGDLTDDILSNILQIAKATTEYEIDGLVIDVDPADKRAEMNPTRDTLNPAYSVKFKITDGANIIATKVIDIEINVSKDGYLKPRVNVEPVDVLGVTVQWATGFNMKFVYDNRLQPGSIVHICRAGDVVPFLHHVEPSTVDFEEFTNWFLNKVSQFGEYDWTETGVDIVLVNASENDTARFEQLVAFFDSLDVSNLGEGNLRKIFDAGFETPEQVLMLTLEDICLIVNSKPIGKKIFTGLHSKLTNIPLYKLMGAHPAFGRGVGVRKMKMLYDGFSGDMTKCVDLNSIVNVDGFDEKTAKKIVKGYPVFMEFLDYVSQVVTIQQYVAPVIGKFTSNVFVFTGFRSPALEKQIQELGGKVGSSVSSKTSYVVTENPNGSSGKLDKARSLNIPVIGVNELKDLLA